MIDVPHHGPRWGSCVLCADDREARLLFEVDRPIVQCLSCGLVYDQPHRQGQDASAYAESYYRGAVYADYLAERPVIRKNAKRVLHEIEQRVRDRDILDVGCAAGFFLEAARDRGWRVRGIDISEYAVNQARRIGLSVDVGSMVAPPPGLALFDVVTMWDTIEHVDRPDIAVANILKHLKPGGLLIVSTGDYASLLRRVTGRRWRLFGDRTHRFFFTERTLSSLLSKAGFQVQKVRRHGKSVGLPMILHQSPLPFGSLVGRWLDRVGWHPSFYVNLGDVMTVFATARHPQ